MSDKIVLDSCVFSKQFLEESDSYQANALIERLITNKVDILVPSLFIYEVLATVNIGNYPVNEVYELIADFQKTQLHTIELDEKHIAKTLEICETGHIKSGFPSFYDACYHALAIIHNCHFVTADKKHFYKTQHLGHIVLLNDWKTAF